MKRVIASIVCAALVLLPTMAIAEGRITPVQVGQKAPYAGFLLDAPAMTKIQIDKRYMEREYKLKYDFDLKRQEFDFKLQINKLEISLEAQETKYNSILELKNNEIESLTQLALEEETDYSTWWFVGGFIAGAGLTALITYAVVDDAAATVKTDIGAALGALNTK